MERQRIRHEDEQEWLGGGSSGFFSGATAASDAVVTVCHGPYAEQLPVAGETVSRVRSLYADRFDLDPQSQAVIDGRPVEDDVRIEAGQSLVFVRRAGEKGTAHVWLSGYPSGWTR